MKTPIPIKKKRIAKPKPQLCSALDFHSWATKMEIKRLISGKPDIKPVIKLIQPRP